MDTKEPKTKIECKSTEIISILTQNFSGIMNLSRIKFFGLMICALCKVQTVCFEKLATAFESTAKRESSLRRIQRFMAGYLLDTDLIARFIFKLLPHQPPYRLTMDRTNWKIGETNINVLALAIVYKGVAFPVLILMLDKKGNSNTQERIDIVNQYIRLFGTHTIDCLLADREFVGERWIKYLNDSNIRYFIRIKENFYVDDPRTGRRFKASWMFNHLKHGECLVLYRIYYVNGQLCYLSGSKVKNQDGKLELQIIIAFNKPEDAQQLYKERWQIETAFRGLKSSGFNIEATHLTDINRMKKLFSIVMVAFAWCYAVGVFVDENIKAIRLIGTTEKRAKSFFKYGLETIAEILLNPLTRINVDVFKFLLST
jgi:hypothetical protein